jgi:hypothetical protein
VLYGITMMASSMRIADHSTPRSGNRQTAPRVRQDSCTGDPADGRPGNDHKMGTNLCMNLCTFGGRRINSGDCRKVRWITLGIRKYFLTWDFPGANVSLVPESACKPGSRDRVCEVSPSGLVERKTDPIHEARAAPVGARSHMLRSTESPGNRRPRAEE